MISAEKTAAESIASPVPITVLTSAGLADETGWAAVDGDLQTAWVGPKPGGGYILVEYGPSMQLTNLEVDLAVGSMTNLTYLYSTNAIDWQPLPDDMQHKPVDLNFLWLVFPDDGTPAVPQVLEIRPNP